MAADIIQIRDFQKKPKAEPSADKASDYATPSRDKLLYESQIGYVAPEKDPA